MAFSGAMKRTSSQTTPLCRSPRTSQMILAKWTTSLLKGPEDLVSMLSMWVYSKCLYGPPNL